ncbi:phage tail tube protein [Anaerosinus massiliensis]|uniref:phage tail tube protein n=1 Tax=Massilibacillus massiliensis TaxID=1806837 RepID=UPI000DA5EF09|nr:hypothetical protein [Massilibacillus massiliensis]
MSKTKALERDVNNHLSSFNFDMQLFGTPTPNDLIVGKGKVYFRRWNYDGTKQALRHMGNCPDFKMTPNIEKIQKMSSMDAAAELYAEAVKSMSYKPTLTLDEFNPFNLALALYGTEGIEIQAEKTIEKEIHDVTLGAVLQVPYKNIKDVSILPAVATPAVVNPATSYVEVGTPGTGKVISGGIYTGSESGAYYIEITKENSVEGTITDAEFTWRKELNGDQSAPVIMTGLVQELDEGVTVKFEPGASGQDFVVGEIYEIKVTAKQGAYISGVDYIIDDTQLRGGVIPIPDTSNILDGSQVFVSYTVPEKKYPKIMGGTAKKIEGDLLFIGDPSTGRPYTLEIWHVSVTPNGDVGLITEEWGSFTLELSVMPDRVNHPKEPFFKMVNTD